MSKSDIGCTCVRMPGYLEFCDTCRAKAAAAIELERKAGRLVIDLRPPQTLNSLRVEVARLKTELAMLHDEVDLSHKSKQQTEAKNLGLDCDVKLALAVIGRAESQVVRLTAALAEEKSKQAWHDELTAALDRANAENGRLREALEEQRDVNPSRHHPGGCFAYDADDGTCLDPDICLRANAALAPADELTPESLDAPPPTSDLLVCTELVGAPRCRPFSTHILEHGSPLCGFAPPPPSRWPEGHAWVRRGDPHATCPACKALAP